MARRGRPKGVQKILPCVLCGGMYDLHDVEEGRYDGESLVCLRCQTTWVQSTHSCFGKRWQAQHEPCVSLCPDRKACLGVFSVRTIA